VIFDALWESARRGELLLIDGGFCHWHLRRDGQLTIREIISTRPGAGREMLDRLKAVEGATALVSTAGVHAGADRPDAHAQDGGERVGMPVLIYCAGGSRQFSDIAVAAGFAYGCRSDHKPNHPVVFADLDWKRPDLDRHRAFVAEHRPRFAVAPDVLDPAALPETLRYAERLAAHAERVIVVPKVDDVVEALPRDPWLMLGYSVPTKYGGCQLMLGSFAGWDVHLLGGSPVKQLPLAHYLRVVSADGNAAARAAAWGKVFDGRKWLSSAASAAVCPMGPDLPYRAFDLSCRAIVSAWRELYREDAA
jgi:hypothetical protein